MAAKMFKELGRRLDDQSEKLDVFNKELENIKQNQIESTKTEIKRHKNKSTIN